MVLSEQSHYAQKVQLKFMNNNNYTAAKAMSDSISAMENSNMISTATANDVVCNDEVEIKKENSMDKEDTKSAGISHPAANMANLGNNIDKNGLEYLNEKVTYEIEGFSGKFEHCRWMHNIVSMAATKAQFKSFAYLTRIAWNWDNFYSYFHRLMCAPEEAGMLRKDLRNIKALMKTVKNSTLPYRYEFLSRMEPLVEEFTKMHNEYGKRCEIIHEIH